MLQEQEASTPDGISMLDQDRLLAIEAQDKELAKLLQEKVQLFINFFYYYNLI